MIETTFVMFKPDLVSRGFGAALAMLEELGLEVLCIERREVSRAFVGALYAAHVDKPYFAAHAAFMTSGPVVGVLLRGEDAIGRARRCLGPTDPESIDPGSDDSRETIRGRWGGKLPRNAAHASDTLEAAAREYRLFWPLRGEA